MFRVLEYFSYIFLLFAASQPPRSCKDMQKGITDGGYFLGNASPHSALILVLSLFPLFCPAVSECVEQQGPTQVLGAPRSPLTHCICCPRGHHKPLFTLAPPSYPLSLWSRARAGYCAGHRVVPGCLLKNLGENCRILRPALAMPTSP